MTEPLILGIDPALASIGYGLIRGNSAIDYGVVTTSSADTMCSRLQSIRNDFRELLPALRPTIIGIEMPFFGRENTNAVKVIRALGVIQLAIADSGYNDSDIVWLHQSQVKSTIAQYGASKSDIQDAVMHVFGLPSPPKPDDAADGLAIAYAVQSGASANVA